MSLPLIHCILGGDGKGCYRDLKSHYGIQDKLVRQHGGSPVYMVHVFTYVILQ